MAGKDVEQAVGEAEELFRAMKDDYRISSDVDGIYSGFYGRILRCWLFYETDFNP